MYDYNRLPINQQKESVNISTKFNELSTKCEYELVYNIYTVSYTIS